MKRDDRIQKLFDMADDDELMDPMTWDGDDVRYGLMDMADYARSLEDKLDALQGQEPDEC